jgi:adenylate cyclase class 2
MKTEIEVKFLRIDLEKMRKKLKGTGAVCTQSMRMMRRVTFGTPEMIAKNAYVRVRDEGHRITMTYKQFDEMSLTGAKEIEVNVSDYEDAVALIQAAGIKVKSKQEARRELWRLGEVEIMLDEWPWLQPFMEIEGPTEAAIKQMAEALGLLWSQAVFGDLNEAFKVEYPHMSAEDAIYHLSEIRFGLPLPDMLKTKTA